MATSALDIQKGMDALTYFHNYSALYYSSVYKLTLEQLIQVVGGKFPQIFLDSYGFTIRTLEADHGLDLKRAIESLARSAQGRLPATTAYWYQALTSEVQNYSWIDAAIATAEGTAKDLAVGAQSVGNTVIDTFKSVQMFIPIGVLIFLGYYFYVKGRRLAE